MKIKLCFLILLHASISHSAAAEEISSEEITLAMREQVKLPPQENLLDCKIFTFQNQLSIKQISSLALSCNQSAKTKLAEIHISAAEMRQLGLLQSPQIGFGTLFPVSSPGYRIGYEARVEFNLMDIIQLPARKRLGKAEYERKKQEITSEILQILTTVKIAYYEYQANLQLQAFWQANLKAAESAAALAQEQKRAGNISVIDKSQQQAFLKMAQLEYIRAENQIQQSRINLAKQAGLPLDNSSWQIVQKLPALPEHLPSLEKLQERAGTHRAELLAQKKHLEQRQKSLELAKLNFFPQLNLGLKAERDPEGNRGVGPFIEMRIPFLGHQSADLQKARAELAVSRLALSALEQNTSSILEQIYQRILLANQTVRFYKNDVLPLQERIMKESLKYYNYMLLGNYQLLLNKQNQLHAQKESIQALLEFWVAYAELENIVGGSLEEI